MQTKPVEPDTALFKVGVVLYLIVAGGLLVMVYRGAA